MKKMGIKIRVLTGGTLLAKHYHGLIQPEK